MILIIKILIVAIAEIINPQYNGNSVAPLIQMDLNGKFIARFDGTKDAERKTGFKSNRIADACNGVIKTSKGYRWKYINDSLDKQNIQQ